MAGLYSNGRDRPLPHDDTRGRGCQSTTPQPQGGDMKMPGILRFLISPHILESLCPPVSHRWVRFRSWLHRPSDELAVLKALAPDAEPPAGDEDKERKLPALTQYRAEQRRMRRFSSSISVPFEVAYQYNIHAASSCISPWKRRAIYWHMTRWPVKLDTIPPQFNRFRRTGSLMAPSERRNSR